VSQIPDSAIRQSIEDLINEFCWRVDNKQGERVAELFTADATVDTPHFNLSGNQQIHTLFSERANDPARVSRHYWSNLRITPAEGGGHIAQVYVLNLLGSTATPSDSPRFAAGACTDRIVFENGKALFSNRKLEFVFEGHIGAVGASK